MCRAACQAVQTTSEGQRAKAYQGMKLTRMKSVPMHLLFFGDFTGTANEGETGAGTDQVVDWNLGDRIVNIRSSFVPFGLRGTIVGLHPTTGTVEVIFDTTFIGGNTLHGVCANGRGRVVKWTDLLAVDASNVKVPKIVMKKKMVEKNLDGSVRGGESKETKKTMRPKGGMSDAKRRHLGLPEPEVVPMPVSAIEAAGKPTPAPVVQQLLKKGGLTESSYGKSSKGSDSQQQLNTLLSNMKTKSQPSSKKKSSQSGSSSAAPTPEQNHLNSLLANAKQDPSKKKQDAAHLNRLLANATTKAAAQPPSPQMPMQILQAPPRQQQMQMMPGMTVPMPMMMPSSMMMMPPMPMMPPQGAMRAMGGGAPLGPMPTSSSPLGPMPSSGQDGEAASGLVDEATMSPSKSTSKTTTTKKIPRQKKEAGSKSSLLMPSQMRR